MRRQDEGKLDACQDFSWTIVQNVFATLPVRTPVVSLHCIDGYGVGTVMASASIKDRVPRERADKFAERRAELAAAAVLTLSELGYARTSLREIAQNSEFSHGVLHYYFKDKVDLITCCVRHYKERCVTSYDQVTAEAASYDGLLNGFVEGLGVTMREEANLHRLWYDLRAQALFEPAFRADVADIDKSLEDMIWRIMTRFRALQGVSTPMSP